MNHSKTVVSVFLAVSALLACASSDNSSEKYPDVTAFCSAKATEECTQVSSICGATADVCKTKRADACKTFAAAASARKYTPSYVQPCLDKTKEVYAKRVITPDDIKAMNDTCGRVFQGSGIRGGACKTDFDCSGAFVCDKDVCDTKVVKQKGDGCANAGEVCDKGSFCQDAKRCAAKKTSGETCDAKAPCVEDLRCQAGTCAARVGSGELCGSDDDCAPSAPFCDKSGASPKCLAGSVYAPATPYCKDFGG